LAPDTVAAAQRLARAGCPTLAVDFLHRVTLRFDDFYEQAPAALLSLDLGTLGAAQQAFVRGMQLAVSLSAAVAVVVAVMATVLLRAVPVQADAGQQPAAPPEPEVAARPSEQPVQIIRVGSGCMACPSERQPTGIQGTAP
jgi:hypothetical protein